MDQQRTTTVSPSAAEASAQEVLAETWEILSGTPVVARHLGLGVERMPDIGLDAVSRRSRAGRDILDRLDALDTAELAPDLILTLGAARALAAGWAREEEWYWLAFDPLGEGFFSMFAPSAYSGGFVLNIVHEAFSSVELTHDRDVEQHLVTIDAYARLVRQLTERTQGQAERGIFLPRLQLANAIPLMTGLKGVASDVLRAVTERSAAHLSPTAQTRIDEHIASTVEPAYDELLTLLGSADYAAHAPDTVGIGSYPGGAEIYAELVALHTTLQLSPQEVHDRGHERMTWLEGEMRALLDGEGFDGSPAEYLRALADDPAWRATTDEGIAAHFQRYIDRFDAEAPRYFGTLPRAPHGVTALPAAVSGSMTFGYYSPPQPDRDLGLYLFNGANLSQTSLPMIAALNYHELMPGHHLHLALQHEAVDLHPLRRFSAVTAFSEGWAEYAARFAGEIGMYREPEERFGRLMMEAFLTSRLVVDTGMNAFGWSLEQARAYMRAHAFMGETEIDSETLRYSCDIPGQALAYKLGDDYLYDLREEVRAERGARFDIADFHDAVLRAAGLPLRLVAEYVRGELA